jgi:arylsulfatase A-like enzyme
MRRRDFFRVVVGAAGGFCVSGCVGPIGSKAGRGVEKRNIIFILADDLGYGDLGCYGAARIKTPRIDRMATEGMRFTTFYTQPVCGPTRAAIMTGCYPMRVAEYGNIKRHHPFVHVEEIFIPEVLKKAGYVSACIGKWDLNGHRSDGFPKGITPNKQGFDYFYGRPSEGDIYRNDQRLGEAPTKELTKRYTDEAVNFIEQNSSRPFFIYLAHTMPHVPLAASADFKGRSERGLYGDVVEELDFNVGRILDKLKELQIDDRTVVIFASDNGPWPYWTGADKSGSAGPLRGQKCETWEGGVRVPFIARGPGLVPAGRVCDAMIGDVDMLPTFARIAGVDIPGDRVIDGKNVLGLITGQTDVTPVKARYYYYDTHLQAVRSGDWKLFLPRPKCPPWLSDQGKAENWRGRDVEEIVDPQLYNLQSDIGEKTDVAQEHPEIVGRLLDLAQTTRADIGDYNRIGQNARFFDTQPRRPDVAKWKDK